MKIESGPDGMILAAQFRALLRVAIERVLNVSAMPVLIEEATRAAVVEAALVVVLEAIEVVIVVVERMRPVVEAAEAAVRDPVYAPIRLILPAELVLAVDNYRGKSQ